MFQHLPYAHTRHIKRPALFTGSGLNNLPLLAQLIAHYDPYVVEGAAKLLFRPNVGDPLPPTIITKWRDGITTGGFTDPPAANAESQAIQQLKELGASLILGPRVMGRTQRLSDTVQMSAAYQALARLTNEHLHTYAKTVFERLFSTVKSPLAKRLDPFTEAGQGADAEMAPEHILGDVIFLRSAADFMRSSYILNTPEDAVAESVRRNYDIQSQVRGYRYLTGLIRAHAELRLFLIRYAIRQVMIPESKKQLVYLGHGEKIAAAETFMAGPSFDWLNAIDRAYYGDQNGPTPWHQDAPKKLVERALISTLENPRIGGSFTEALNRAIHNLIPLLRSIEILREPMGMNIGVVEPILHIGSGSTIDLGRVVLPYANDERVIYTDGIRASLPSIAVTDLTSGTWLKAAAPEPAGGFITQHTGPLAVGVVKQQDYGAAFPAIQPHLAPHLFLPAFESASRMSVSLLTTPPAAIQAWNKYQGGVFSQLTIQRVDGAESPLAQVARWLGTTASQLIEEVLRYPGDFGHFMDITVTPQPGEKDTLTVSVKADVTTLYYGDLRVGSELNPRQMDWPRAFEKHDRIRTFTIDQLNADLIAIPEADVLLNRAYPEVAYDMTPDFDHLMKALLPSKVTDLSTSDLPSGGPISVAGPSTVQPVDDLIVGAASSKK